MNQETSLHFILHRIERRSLLVGIVGLVLGGAGFFLDRAQFFQSYLFATLFWLSITLGCLAILMLHHLVSGRWGFVIQRLLESGARTLPVMAVFFLFLMAFGLHDLYEWTHPDVVDRDELLRHKSPYLNVTFFWVRAVLYLVIWFALAHVLTKWSWEQDRTGDPWLTRRLQAVSGPGLVLYVLTMSFAAIDWIMSLEPHWFSTIYGFLIVVGQALTTLAFLIIILAVLARHQPLAEIVSRSHFHDLGNLMLAFIVLWAYMSFAQFLLIWSGNLPEEIPWYLHRIKGSWQAMAITLMLFHFAVPFFLLLFRRTKREVRMLVAVAGLMIVMRLIDLFWLVVPAFQPTGVPIHWTHLAILVGIGGIWMAAFAGQLKGRSMIPVHDPRVQEALHHA